jgi:hypothetical protein
MSIASLGGGGWVRVAGTGERWINLTTARSVTAN